MSNLTQRDAFWNKVYEMAKTNRDIVVLTADMGAPALDKFRIDFPSQFVNVGIAFEHTCRRWLRAEGNMTLRVVLA